ncbi:hypothetical protein ElyMa_000958700, partial [Elysia marginata]
FRENLLMTAIRYDQKEMAEFLLDNGVDHTYSTSIVGMRETARGKVLERYQLTCRQMAYDKGMYDTVDLIDSLQGQLFPFIRLPERMPRFRRPRPPTPSELESGSGHSSEGADISSEGEMAAEDNAGKDNYEKQQTKKKRKKKNSGNGSVDGKLIGPEGSGIDEEDGDGDRGKTPGAGSAVDVDSGHHSLASSKLKMALLREHDRLMEKEEKEEEEQQKKERSEESSSNQRQKLRKARGSASSAAQENVGSVISRTQNEGKSETLKEGEGSGDEERDGTRDEGYGGSASFHSGLPGQQSHQIMSPDPVRPWDKAPKNRIRSTKSALTVRKSLHQRFGRRILSGSSMPLHHSESGYSSSLPLKFEMAPREDISNSPLHWKKVSTVGSYARESRQWHQAQTNESQDTLCLPASVQISEFKLGSPPAQDIPHRSSTASKAAVLPKSITKSSSATANAGATSSGFGRLSTSSSSSSTSLSAGASAANTLETSSCVSHPHYRPGSTPVAGYMRATRSTANKCRLTPRFASSYGALDFQAKIGSGKVATTWKPSQLIGSSNQGIDNITLAVAKMSTQMIYSDAPLAPRVVPKKTTIPAVASAIGEHQKRNQSAISYRS